MRAVRTRIQSGNVVFDSSESDASVVENAIEDGIRMAFGLSVAVILRAREELERIIADNPFVGKGLDVGKLHVTFLSHTPTEAPIIPSGSAEPGADAFHLSGREIYLFCPNGYGRTKLSDSFFEQKLGVSATTRNWRTVNALLALASNNA